MGKNDLADFEMAHAAHEALVVSQLLDHHPVCLAGFSPVQAA